MLLYSVNALLTNLNMSLTTAQLQAAVMGCNFENASKRVAGVNLAIARYGINTPLRLAHFLAQVGHESIGFSAATESLNYTADSLINTFSRARISAEDAQKFGRSATLSANQVEIGNRVYGGDWGVKNLGNTEPGDGYKFRGRGPIQITGRANYRETGKALGLNLEAYPEQINIGDAYALSAGYYWNSRNLNALADKDGGKWDGVDKAIFISITRAINGGINGWEDRQARFIHARAALGIPAPLKVPAATV